MSCVNATSTAGSLPCALCKKRARISKQPSSISGGCKKTYLDGICRFLKLYETLYDLQDIYDTPNWSWVSSPSYEKVEKSLDNTTVRLESHLSAKQRRGPNYADHLSDKAFARLNAFTYHCAQQEKHRNFPLYLNRMMHWYMQLILVFCCPRSEDELAVMTLEEMKPVDSNRLRYEVLHGLKGTTLNAHKQIVQKKPWALFITKLYNFIAFSLLNAFVTLTNATDFFFAPHLLQTWIHMLCLKENHMGSILLHSASKCMQPCCKKSTPLFQKETTRIIQ